MVALVCEHRKTLARAILQASFWAQNIFCRIVVLHGKQQRFSKLGEEKRHVHFRVFFSENIYACEWLLDFLC
jgi:hypothetical protein